MKGTLRNLFIVCVAVVIGFSSCQKTENASSGGSEPAVLNLALSQAEHTDDIINYLPAFEEKENVKVEYEIITESGYIQKLLLALSTEEQEYDVFMSSNSMWGQLLDSRWIHGLNEFMDNPELTSAEWKDGFSQSMLDVVMRDGERYATVYQMGTNILYYNKAIFEKNGLDPNDPPKTLEEVLEVAKLLNNPEEEEYGIAFRASRENSANSFFWIMLFFAQGGDWYNDAGEDELAIFESEAAINATKYFAEFHKYAPKGIANYGFEDAMLAMQQGRIAMWIDVSILAGNLLDPEKSKITEDIGFIALDEGKTIGAPWTFMMAKNTKEKEAAWKLMQYLTDFDITWGQVQSGHQTAPVRRDILAHEEIEEYINRDLAQALSAGLENAAPIYFPNISQMAEIRSILSIAISDVATKNASAEEEMKKVNQKVREIIERDGLK